MVALDAELGSAGETAALAGAATEGQRADGGDPASEHETGDAGRDHDLGLVVAQLGAPVGELDDLQAEVVEGGAEVLAVALDGVADLLGAALGHQVSLPELMVARIFSASSIAIFGIGAPTFSLRRANTNAPAVSSSRMTMTMAKPSHRSPVASLIAQAMVSSTKTRANTPNTAPTATAAAPRAMLDTFSVTSALASSISSRTRTESFSETSVTAVARLSPGSGRSAGKALEDHGEDESAGERRTDGQLGALLSGGHDDVGRSSRGRGWRCRVGQRGLLGPDRRGGVVRARLLAGLRALSGIAHSGGSSSNKRFQTRAAARVEAMLASTPNPASRPDQIRRLTKGLSVIGPPFKQTRPMTGSPAGRAARRVQDRPDVPARGRWCRRSSSWRARGTRRRRAGCRRSTPSAPARPSRRTPGRRTPA